MKNKLKFPKNDGSICICPIELHKDGRSYDIGVGSYISNRYDNFLTNGHTGRFPRNQVDLGILILSTKPFRGSFRYEYGGKYHRKFTCQKLGAAICLLEAEIVIRTMATEKFKTKFYNIINKERKGSIYLKII